MPIFEYQCTKCSHEFEMLVLPTLPPPECPSCHSKELEKQISSFAVSSDSIRQANAKSSRKDQIAKNKDKAIAEHDEMHHHDH